MRKYVYHSRKPLYTSGKCTVDRGHETTQVHDNGKFVYHSGKNTIIALDADRKLLGNFRGGRIFAAIRAKTEAKLLEF